MIIIVILAITTVAPFAAIIALFVAGNRAAAQARYEVSMACYKRPTETVAQVVAATQKRHAETISLTEREALAQVLEILTCVYYTKDLRVEKLRALYARYTMTHATGAHFIAEAITRVDAARVA